MGGRQAAEGQPAESQQRNMVDFEGALGPILREFGGTYKEKN